MKTALLASLVALTIGAALLVSPDTAAVSVAASGALVALMFAAHRLRTSPHESRAMEARSAAPGAHRLAEEAALPIYRVDLRTRAFARVPPELRDAWGPGHAELCAAGGYDLFEARIHPDDLPASRSRFAPADSPASEPRAARVDLRIADASGRYRWWRDGANLALDAHGRPRFLHGTLVDISDLKERNAPPRAACAAGGASHGPHPDEAVFAESDPRYALAMRGTNEGLWEWKPLTGELFLSSRVLSALGETGEHRQTTGQAWFARVHPDDRPRLRTSLVAHLKGETPHFECEYRVLDRHEQYRWVLARGLAQRGATGMADRMVGSIGDVTERKDAEAGMRDLNRALETRVAERTAQLGAALKELESFSYSVSHDLRAPLRAIDGYSAILMTEYGERLDSEAWLLLQRIRSGVHRMSDLIDDLLDLARVSRYPLTREEVDLSALAESVVRGLQESEPSREVEVELAPGLVAQADPKLLRIALENLLGNAWKFTARTAQARVRLGRCEDESGAAWFFVEDNGAGFDMRYVHKLFTPFQRLHHEREFGGTGIGLATVARIVHRHGGRVSAHSAAEGGARFAFTLEVQEEAVCER